MDSKLLTKKEEFFSPEDKFEIGAVLVLVGQACAFTLAITVWLILYIDRVKYLHNYFMKLVLS